MIECKDLNESFETKEQLFKALKENKDELIYLKKSQIQKSCEKDIGVRVKIIDPSKLQEHNKELKLDDDFYYIAVNTTKILDSHNDLHLDGIWNRTVKNQQGKNYLVLDHNLSISDTVVRKEDIEMFLAEIPFSMIGKSYTGNTQALIYKFRKENIIHQKAKEWLLSGNHIEASVRMQYVKLDLALNSEDENDKEEKRLFDKHFPDIANKEDFEEEILFFWVVTEAKNVRESSLVLAGSNGATGVVEDKQDPRKSTPEKKDELAAQALHQDQLDFYKHLN